MSSVTDVSSDLNGRGRCIRDLRSIDLDGRPAPVIAVVDGESHEINPWDLREEGAAVHFHNVWANTSQPIVFVIRHLLDWSHEDRWNVFLFIRQLGLPNSVQVAEDAPPASSLFEAVLAMMVGHADIDRCERGRRAAQEAAALIHPAELRVACSRIVERLRQLEVRGYRINDVLAEARVAGRAASGAQSADEEHVYVADVLPDASLCGEAIVPPGWRVTPGGIWSTRNDSEEALMAGPILITQRFTNISDGTESLQLAWHRAGRWQARIVERADVAAVRTVVELANFGLPVNSNNASDVVQFLADFEAANIDLLPCEAVTRQLGWQGRTTTEGFVCGRQWITCAGQPHHLPQDGLIRPSSRVTFRGRDHGDEQLVDGYQAAGSFAAWHDAVRGVGHFPRVRLAVYASLSPVLLAIVNSSNYVLSFSGPTSGGKTTTLRIAASPWGRPDERSPQATIGTWDSTRTWIERAAGIQCDLPLILDDTKRARRGEDVAQTLYDVTSGRGRGRGSIDGISGTGTFRSVLISSGEAPITSFTRDGGTRARVLEVWGSPFGAANAQIAPIVTATNELILENYGHAGPQFVTFLAGNQSRWPNWRQAHRQLRLRYSERAGNNSVAGRMATHFALLDLTVQLAVQAGVVPWPEDHLVWDLWPELVAGTADADQAEGALRYIWSWATANTSAFFGRYANRSSPPPGGWAGRWEHGNEGRDWELLMFYPHRLEQVLHEADFEPEPVVHTWRDRNWLRTSSGRRFYRCRLGGHPEDLIAITREAIESLLGDEQPATSTAPRGVASPPG